MFNLSVKAPSLLAGTLALGNWKVLDLAAAPSCLSVGLNEADMMPAFKFGG